MLQRYQNVKAELEAQQNLERIRMEKLVQSGALTSTRKGGNAGGRQRGGAASAASTAPLPDEEAMAAETD